MVGASQSITRRLHPVHGTNLYPASSRHARTDVLCCTVWWYMTRMIWWRPLIAQSWHPTDMRALCANNASTQLNEIARLSVAPCSLGAPAGSAGRRHCRHTTKNKRCTRLAASIHMLISTPAPCQQYTSLHKAQAVLYAHTHTLPQMETCSEAGANRLPPALIHRRTPHTAEANAPARPTTHDPWANTLQCWWPHPLTHMCVCWPQTVGRHPAPHKPSTTCSAKNSTSMMREMKQHTLLGKGPAS